MRRSRRVSLAKGHRFMRRMGDVKRQLQAWIRPFQGVSKASQIRSLKRRPLHRWHKIAPCFVLKGAR